MGKIGLIVEREFKQRVVKRSFLVVTFLMPLMMVALIFVPMLINRYDSNDKQREIVVVDESGVVAGALQNNEILTFTISTKVSDDALAEYPSAYGVLKIGDDIVANPSSAKLYTHQAVTMSVEKDIKRQLSNIVTAERIRATGIEKLDSLMTAVQARASIQTFEIVDRQSPESKTAVVEKSSALSMGLAYGAGFLIYMFVFIYGMMVLQGVVEEKSNRIVEVIVSSVRPFELMMGKIIGIALVALLQFTLWVIVAIAILVILPSIDPSVASSMVSGIDLNASAAVSGSTGSFSMLFDPWFVTKIIGGFIIFFVGGYLLYASMFAAVGSAVDNTADTQQLQLPITIPLIIALMVLMSVIHNPHSSVAFWFSIIPFTSPIIMVARIPYGVPLWEFLLSVGLLYATFVAMTGLAAKIYRTGIFMYGKKPTLLEIIRWARYKN